VSGKGDLRQKPARIKKKKKGELVPQYLKKAPCRGKNPVGCFRNVEREGRHKMIGEETGRADGSVGGNREEDTDLLLYSPEPLEAKTGRRGESWKSKAVVGTVHRKRFIRGPECVGGGVKRR